MNFLIKRLWGLYIHISCLIERLVTKEALNYGDVTKFALEHTDFIAHVKTSFENIFRNYGIDLPLSEMSYLYDYISIDSTNHITRQKRGFVMKKILIATHGMLAEGLKSSIHVLAGGWL